MAHLPQESAPIAVSSPHKPAGKALNLTLLGGFSARGETGDPIEISSKKNRALLVILALSPQMTMTRKGLAGLLWSDRDEAHARSSLRQSLAVLRKELQLGNKPLLEISEETIRLPADDVYVDALEFLQAAQAPDAPSLRRAADLYQDELVAGVATGDEMFEDWLAGRRSLFRQTAIRAFDTLARMESGSAQIAACQRLLALDPLREASHRMLMRAYATGGENGLALKQYDICRNELRRELGVEPAQETRDLRAGIAQGSIEAALDPAIPLPEKPSIGVLPFENLSEDREQEYFADGMVDELITALSRFRQLFVIARNSSFSYKGRNTDVRQVARELGVRYLVEGSVRKAGQQIRITCQVIDASSGHHMWADRFEGQLADVFHLQDQVSESIARAIEPKLRDAEIKRAREKPTSDLTSYDLYLRALYELYDCTAESFERAEALLRQAIDRDPHFADAIAVLATCIARQGFEGWRPLREALREALGLARRAVQLDNISAEVLATGAYCEAFCGGSFDRSEELAAAALRANPNSIQVLILCGGASASGGECERAIELLQTARRINPLDPQDLIVKRGIGLAYFFSRKFEEAAVWERRALGQQPNDNIAKRYLASSLAHLGRIAEARQVVADLLKSQPNSSLSRAQANTFRHAWMMDLYIDGLRKAGLPE